MSRRILRPVEVEPGAVPVVDRIRDQLNRLSGITPHRSAELLGVRLLPSGLLPHVQLYDDWYAAALPANYLLAVLMACDPGDDVWAALSELTCALMSEEGM